MTRKSRGVASILFKASARYAAFVAFTVALSNYVGRAEAADQKLLGEFKAWNAFSERENGKKTCHLESDPIKEEGKYRRRGDTYIQVTGLRRNQQTTVAVIAGYTYRKQSQVTLTISGNRFRLQTQRDIAWSRSAQTGDRLLKAMKSGRHLIVRGRSSRGTLTTVV